MSSYWEALAARTDGLNTADEFESAAYRLVTEQVIYHADSRVAYDLIDRYRKDFERALEPLGIVVMINGVLRYAYAKPQHVKNGTATVAQTLLALVLRSLYDESARAGQLTDNGEVLCDLIELEEKYRLLTEREPPPKMELNALLKQLKRWGIAKMADEHNIDEMDSNTDSQIYVLIRPAIIDVLGETALQRLGHWAQNRVAKAAANIEPGSDEVAA